MTARCRVDLTKLVLWSDQLLSAAWALQTSVLKDISNHLTDLD